MKILNTIKDVVATKAARQILFTKHHSPKILFVAGTIGVIGTVILACRATLKASETLDEHEIAATKLERKNQSVQDDAMSDEDFKKETNALKIKTGLELTKLYLPVVGLGAASILALTGSHMILTRRNGVLVASYAALDQAHKAYRQRVADEYGVDVDRKFVAGGESVTIIEKTADGGVKTKTETRIGNYIGGSPYAAVFDEHSRFFSREPGANQALIAMKQNYANDKLRAQGHLYLMEVLDMLGLPRTEASTIVGWVYHNDVERQKRIAQGLRVGDNYVDFGVFNGEPEWVDAFLDGVEKTIILDFNVDGTINDILFGKN